MRQIIYRDLEKEGRARRWKICLNCIRI